jgi:hypothetical protein
MVTVKRRPRRKIHCDPHSNHDFSEDQEHCGLCGMQRSVWQDTHVPCPGEPYTIDKHRLLNRRVY